jgi:plastocyanin
MANSIRLIPLLLCLLLLGFASFAAGCSSPAPAAPAAATPAPSGGANAVTIASFAFSPNELTVKTGSTVTWTNNDPASHTIVADTGAFSSDPFGKGDTYQFTFNQPGTYPYHCSLHPSMKGTILVQA